jgi:hypothetical protein
MPTWEARTSPSPTPGPSTRRSSAGPVRATSGVDVVAADLITDVDPTAADMLEDLDEALNAKGISLVLAEMKDPAREMVERYELTRTIDPSHVFPTVGAAAAAFRGQFGPTGLLPPASRLDDLGRSLSRCGHLNLGVESSLLWGSPRQAMTATAPASHREPTYALPTRSRPRTAV